jgi:uncharacterized repeat protein (TIGR01451 family)
LSFIENRGQVDHRVNYYLQGAGSSLYFTSRGLTLSLGGKTDRWVVQQRFLTGQTVEPQARDPLPGVVSYFKGSPEEWVTAIPTYAEVAYRDLWPGVDLVYSGDGTTLKYDLLLRPGADPSAIRMAYRGATGLEVTPAGRLRVSTGAGTFREDRPYAYQELAGRRVPVSASYVLGPRESYGFHIGDYDPTRPLVIDPVMFIYAGYIGGSGSDQGNAVAVDGGGNAYVAGNTNSSEATFPASVGPDTTYNGGSGTGGDAFVAKVNPAGTGLVYAGYIGGSGTDEGFGVAVDDGGNAYVSGSTQSTEATFPATVGPDTTHNGGGFDAFVAQVNPGGTGLVYAGYIGGSGEDRANGVAVDDGGNAYVAGHTNSSEATFPASVGPDTTYNGGTFTSDAFVAKINPAGTGLVYAGYIGGSSTDLGFGVDVDEGGNAYVVGETLSTEATFPATVGPDTTHNRDFDGFLAKVNPGGTGLLYAGYIGGFGSDAGYAVAVDGGGNAYVVGTTDSPPSQKSGGFPVTVGPDTTYNGDVDAFVAKVNSAGTGFVHAGYIGGTSFDTGRGVAVDDAGNAYVAGQTFSTEATFPATGGPDTTYNGGADAFVAQVNPSGTELVYAGYIGGAHSDRGAGVAVDGAGNAYVTGLTGSTEATFPATVGPDTTFNGFSDAFVAKVGESPSGVDLALTKTDSPDPASPKKILTYSLTVSNDGPGVATGVTVEDQLPPSVTFVSANASRGNCTQAAGVVTCDLDFVAAGEQVTVTINVVPRSTGTITNSAEVSATEPDPNPANNTDVEATEVRQGSTCTKPCT